MKELMKGGQNKRALVADIYSLYFISTLAAGFNNDK